MMRVVSRGERYAGEGGRVVGTGIWRGVLDDGGK